MLRPWMTADKQQLNVAMMRLVILDDDDDDNDDDDDDDDDDLSLIHISEPTRPLYISYAVFCLKKGLTQDWL